MERTEKKVHQGRNVKRFREMLGLKQEALAYELGEDWNQKRVSLLESKEEIDAPILEQVAKALNVPVEAIESFDEQTAINIIGNTVTNVNDHGTGQLFQFHPVINPVEKWLAALEENKQLYERLLQAEREKVELLHKLTSQLQNPTIN